jgi:hypothetical protein
MVKHSRCNQAWPLESSTVTVIKLTYDLLLVQRETIPPPLPNVVPKPISLLRHLVDVVAGAVVVVVGVVLGKKKIRQKVRLVGGW